MFDWFFTSVLSWLAGAVTASIQTLWNWLAATVLTNPDVTVLPQIATISARSRGEHLLRPGRRSPGDDP